MCRRTGLRLTTALCQTPRLDPRTLKVGPSSTFHLVVIAWTVAPSGWLDTYWNDFRQRFLSLLGYSFRVCRAFDLLIYFLSVCGDSNSIATLAKCDMTAMRSYYGCVLL